jgi:hypothetical protein
VPLFDLEKTQEVEALFAQPGERRDRAWRERLYIAIGDASMAAGDPQVFTGPDGFPYFALHLPPIGEGFETFCVNHVLEPCTENGFGCVVHDRQGQAGWVFTYGNLWSQRVAGRFDATPADDEGQAKVLTETEHVLVGAPSDELLPPWARKVLRAHLRAAGIAEPKVAAVSRPDRHPSWSLALTLPEGEEAAHRVTWFVPPHMGVLGAGAVGEGSLVAL